MKEEQALDAAELLFHVRGFRGAQVQPGDGFGVGVVHFGKLRLIPVDLVLVDVVIVPENAEIIHTGVGMAVDKIERLGDKTHRVFHVHGVVAVAVHVFGADLKQAVGVRVAVAVDLGDLGAVGQRIQFGVVVAVGHAPVNAQAFERGAQRVHGADVVDRAGRKRHRKGDVARDDDQIGHFPSDHRRHGGERLQVFLIRQKAAAHVDIGKLQHVEIFIGGEAHAAGRGITLGSEPVFLVAERLEAAGIGHELGVGHHVERHAHAYARHDHDQQRQQHLAGGVFFLFRSCHKKTSCFLFQPRGDHFPILRAKPCAKGSGSKRRE